MPEVARFGPLAGTKHYISVCITSSHCSLILPAILLMNIGYSPFLNSKSDKIIDRYIQYCLFYVQRVGKRISK